MTLLGFLLALASYVLLGYLFKSPVLNWIVGPTYPLVVLYVIPRALGRRRGAREEGRSG